MRFVHRLLTESCQLDASVLGKEFATARHAPGEALGGGPEQPVGLADADVTSIVPLTGTTGNVTAAFAALWYSGQLTAASGPPPLSVVTDPDLFPDLRVLTDGLLTS